MSKLVPVVRYTYVLGWILLVAAIAYRVAVFVYAYGRAEVVRVPIHPRTVLALSAMMFLISIAAGVSHLVNQPQGEGKSRAASA